MRRALALLSLAIAWLLCPPAAGASQPSPPGGFDFSAINRLWAIVSTLEQDREPAVAEWEALVRTPGYAALIAHERGYGLDFLQRNLRLVFKPSFAAELEKAKRSNALVHFLALKEKKPALQAFQAQVQQSPTWNTAVGLLRPWLPEQSIGRSAAPAVTFVVFARDARGGYGPLIFDLLYAYERGGTFASLVAHEMFHYYCRELPAWDPGNTREAYRSVVDALAAIQGEGMADQIDKAAAIEAGPANRTVLDPEYEREYRKRMEDTPQVLSALDGFLRQGSDSAETASRIGSRIRAATPMSGHPTGYFMTRAILADGGKAELVRTFNNPFAFFYLYNAAAKRNTALPRLGNAAVHALRQMERLAGGQPEERLGRAALTEGVDWSSVTAFRTITSELAAEREPDNSLWDRIFATPADQALWASDGDSRQQVREAVSMVYRPSRKADLDRALEGGNARLVRYFVQQKQDGEAAMQAWDGWQQSGTFDRAVEEALAWLPGGARETLAGTTIALTYMGRVDIWYGSETVLADPLWILREGAPASIAKYVRRNLLIRYTDAVRPYDEGMLTRRQAAFLGAWERVQLYGLCDLVSRQTGDPESPQLRKAYDARLQEVSSLVTSADAVMKRAATDRWAWRDFETLQSDFFFAQGSPLGYFIASACLEVLGREALASTAGNPIALLELYQKAAATKGGLPLFSKQSLDWLEQLEREARAGAPRR